MDGEKSYEDFGRRYDNTTETHAGETCGYLNPVIPSVDTEGYIILEDEEDSKSNRKHAKVEQKMVGHKPGRRIVTSPLPKPPPITSNQPGSTSQRKRNIIIITAVVVFVIIIVGVSVFLTHYFTKSSGSTMVELDEKTAVGTTKSVTGKTPEHCGDIYKAGYHENGVYTISPAGATQLDVYCDMSERTGKSDGGWTVFQKRSDGEVDFDRDWFEYRRGFGDVKREHWQGLENIYLPTHSEPMQLFVYLEDWDGNSRWAHYDNFAVSSESSKYRLDIGDYMGTAGDALNKQRGQNFTTTDRDNDIYDRNCARIHKAGWWYEGIENHGRPWCYDSNLNGIYSTRSSRHVDIGIHWYTWREKYSFKTAIMMMKPFYND